MSQPLIMSFRPDAAQMCLDGRKRQTRRIPGDPDWLETWIVWIKDIYGHTRDITPAECSLYSRGSKSPTLIRIEDGDHRTRFWALHETRSDWEECLTIRPSRTAPGIGYVRLNRLRIEHLQYISEADAKAEGVDPVWTFKRWSEQDLQVATPEERCAIEEHGGIGHAMSYVSGFSQVWDRLHRKKGTRWDDNPVVIVIEFEPMVSPAPETGATGGEPPIYAADRDALRHMNTNPDTDTYVITFGALRAMFADLERAAQ